MPGTPATTPNFGLPRYDNAVDDANFAGQVNAITDALDTILDVLLPVGTTIDWHAATAPPTIGTVAYLEALGQSVTATQYPKLAARWGKSGTFFLPDRRGRTPVAAGQGAGLSLRAVGDTFGSETHTLTVAQMPAHDHDFALDMVYVSNNGGDPGGTSTASTYSKVNTTKGPTNQRGGGSPHPITQPSIVTRYFIRVA